MTKLFLSLHVLAAIVTIGPVTVAASMFPPALRRAHHGPGDPDALTTVRTLHRICRVYAGVGIAVPVFGFATASSLGVLGSGWLTASMILTAAAAAVLALMILPTQDRELTALRDGGPRPDVPAAGRLAMLTGVFNLLWATVTVLMIIRPGSTTGA
ncbi:hypothetical protein ABZ801_20180 [Actinomadura sp. NPDC047616]|uniref:hypothetical protein n=1 Tax=Actinomadura sp. NPDC047616 TaxID=3155914 RepID=UPI00340E6F8F